MGQGQSSPSISTVSNSTADDGIAWWCKIGARGACVAGGLGKINRLSRNFEYAVL